MLVEYREETIEIAQQKEKEPIVKAPALATVAYNENGSLGLAYSKRETEDGLDFVYHITHIPTGVLVCSFGTCSESVVRQWIEKLTEIADWTGLRPAITGEPLVLLAFATLGVLYLLEEEEDDEDDEDD